MPKRNPDSPWNPAEAEDISPEEYERQVAAWLRAAGQELEAFEVRHLVHLSGAGGDYEFDAVARFTVLEGAELTVLVECKRYSRPVERETLLSLWAKLQDVKAHKAMIFATCGFQSGALEYAGKYGIAAVAFVEGRFSYERRCIGLSASPPPWAGVPEYAGILMAREDGRVSCSTIDERHIDVLSKWLRL